jgi:threonine/homoserine/homoserine lactone efflux protein
VGSSSHVVPGFLLGVALAAAPGPVQVLILGETARTGLHGGLRVMAGANGALLAVLVTLAVGFSALQPGPGVLRALRFAGGGFLVYLAMIELVELRAEAHGGRRPQELETGRSVGPTARGVLAVVVNPGAWIFFATTASTVVAQATADGGRDAALLVAVAMTAGVSLTDFVTALLGAGGRALFGDRGLRWIRGALATILLAIGIAFVAGAIRGSIPG